MKLSEKTKKLWGKKSLVEGRATWLPLLAHLLDTKNTILWLFHHWLSDGQRKVLEGALSSDEVEQLVIFLGYIHDIGKATPAFQGKHSYVYGESLDEALWDKLVMAGFEGMGKLDLPNANNSPHNRAGEAILEYGGLHKTVAAIIGGHHGQPESQIPRTQLSGFASNYWQTQRPSPLQAHWKTVQQELIGYGLELSGFKSLSDIPAITQPQAVLLTGLLIMADWVASSEYLNGDPAKPMFPLIDIEQTFDDIDIEARYQRAIMTWLQEDVWIPEKVVNIPAHYKKRWGFSPRSVQKKMSEAIGQAEDPGILIIEAPMGVGKTEIALTAAEQLAFQSGRTGVYMGLPTQATSNAMFDRVKSWIEKIGEEEGKNLSIRLMHGKAQFNSSFSNLPKAANINQDEGGGAVTVNAWFAGKKSVLEEFTVGTIDHLLLMGLKQRHLFLKHLGFSNKVVIVDEVHAYDAYMSSYLDKVLEWLGTYHVPVVLLSATLPQNRRNELLQAYSSGKYGAEEFVAVSGWEDNQAYPLLSILDGNRLQQFSDFTKLPSKDIQIFRIEADEQTVMDRVLSKISKGGIAGIIVNTVKRAQKMALLVPEEIPTIILHSAFLATDRAKLEMELQKKIGKDGNRPERLIVIGTQVLEQSLDIDFDVLFTDIAPMDLILQRIGRLHRHKIPRPTAFETPQVYIMGAENFGVYGEANEAIYEKYFLMKTDSLLKKTINIPEDISSLVQKTYAEKVEKDAAMRVSQEQCEQHRDKAKCKAQDFQIDKPRNAKSIHGWLDWAQQGLGQNEIRGQATVRDIKETLEIILLQKTKEEYFLLDGIKIADLPPYEKEQRIARQVIRLPAALTPEYKMDAIIHELETRTRKEFRDWQNSVWLKGELALVLDEHKRTNFEGWRLQYSDKIGLCYKKEEDGEGTAL